MTCLGEGNRTSQAQKAMETKTTNKRKRTKYFIEFYKGRKSHPVVTDDVIFVGTQGNGRHFPVTGEFKVRFLLRNAINANMAIGKRDGFARQTDNAFHVHDMVASDAHPDDVAALGWVSEVGEAIDKIDAVIMIGGFHAAAGDADGAQDESKHHGGDDHKHDQPDEGAFGFASDDHDAQPIKEPGGLRFALHYYSALLLITGSKHWFRGGQRQARNLWRAGFFIYGTGYGARLGVLCE
jgi:hypothetical protein